MTITISVESHSLPPIPGGSLLRLDGTAASSDTEWKSLTEVPGAFFIYRGEPLPIAGNVAVLEKTRDGGWPDPVFVPRVQAHELKRLVGQSFDATYSLKDARLLDLHEIPRVGFKPGEDIFPHQVENARRLLETHRQLLLLPTGMGKTLATLYAAQELWIRGLVHRTLVISSLTAAANVWKVAAHRFYPKEMTPFLVDGSPKRRDALYAAASDPRVPHPLVLTKYDTWRTDQFWLSRLVGPKTLVVIDEVHKLRSPDTLRWRAIRDLLDLTETDYRLFLTGSLVYDKPINAFGPISLLGLHAWNTLPEFHHRYFSIDRIPTGKYTRFGAPIYAEVPGEFKGVEEAKALRTVIDGVSFRKTREELGLYMPPLREEDYLIECSAAEQEMYRELVADVIAGFDPRDEANLLAMLTIERQFSSDPGLVLRSHAKTANAVVNHERMKRLEGLTPGPKLRALVEWLGDFLDEDEDSKVLVFSNFEEIFSYLRGFLTDPKSFGNPDAIPDLRAIARTAVFFDGSLSSKQREEVVKRYTTDPSVRIFFSTDAGGESLNLQGLTTHVIHYDDPLSLGAKDQRVGRAWGRADSRTPVLALRFVLAPEQEFNEKVLSKLDVRFVDERLRDLLEFKAAQRKMVVG